MGAAAHWPSGELGPRARPGPSLPVWDPGRGTLPRSFPRALSAPAARVGAQRPEPSGPSFPVRPLPLPRSLGTEFKFSPRWCSRFRKGLGGRRARVKPGGRGEVEGGVL